jgi:3-oxoacid CoA-transferase subunit A
MFFITGDTHADLRRVAHFCAENSTTVDDVIIILGDVGINYYSGKRAEDLKRALSGLPITMLCVHGNHEARPQSIPGYRTLTAFEGAVFREDAYPNLLFARDGEIYNLDGIEALVIGGAYSQDKRVRLLKGFNWWPDEQPDDNVKQTVERKLDSVNHKVDAIFSHTCPIKYLPREVFLPGFFEKNADHTTEDWLDAIEDATDYKRWYCGHFHIEKTIDRMRFMFEDIIELKV